MITNEQIAAGAAVLCDCGKPIGRNAAICVFDAMTNKDTASEQADSLDWPTGYAEWLHATAKFPYDNDKRNQVDAFKAGVAFALTQQAAAPEAPNGYKLVPFKPTPEMRSAWDKAPQYEDGDREFVEAYQAMIVAAPEAPATQRAEGAVEPRFTCACGYSVTQCHPDDKFKCKQLSATTASASGEVAWLHKLSDYGPWIECNPSAPGAVRFFSGRAPAPSREAAPLDAEGLPPLPKPDHYDTNFRRSTWSEGQVRQAQREAYELGARRAAVSTTGDAAEWIELNDQMPEPEVFVLTWDGEQVGVDWWGSLRHRGDGVTHWAPFQKPPGAGEMYGLHSLAAAPQSPTEEA